MNPTTNLMPVSPVASATKLTTRTRGSSLRLFNQTLFTRTTQLLVWFITSPLYYFFYKVRVIGKQNIIGLKGPLIIVSNHVSWHDSFFIRNCLGFNSQLLPIRFMASKSLRNPFMALLYRIGIVPLVYFLFGAFVIEEGKGLEFNLKNAKQILRDGGVVVMYPEGYINHTDQLLPFKRGAAALAIDENVPILPMYLQSKYNGTAGYEELTAKFGSVFRLNSGESYESGTEVVKEVVNGLIR